VIAGIADVVMCIVVIQHAQFIIFLIIHTSVVNSGRTQCDRGAERPKTVKRYAVLQRGAFGESG